MGCSNVHPCLTLAPPEPDEGCQWFSFTFSDDNISSCENGQALVIYGDFCSDSEMCPIATENQLALSSNCSKTSNHFCPMYQMSSKICMDKVNVSVTDYCSYGRGEQYWKCPKANKGLIFEQCYHM